ncbi:hypothetical protein WMY93_024716 [Mugilogobius chulae]|uniref:Ig-like domain-containing protein n=1 Tax=Mugilogobius chulae TaxID=88201 RepID=A0AAW0N772_9GOBI
MPRILRILLQLIPALLLSSSWCVQAVLRVSVHPSAPVFPLGSRSQLVCRVQGCSGSPSITWAPLDDRPLTATIDANSSHSAVTFDPVQREHEGSLLCKASCGRETRQSVSKVQVYALPSAPQISGPLSVPVSVQSSLICEVRDMYPAELLSVDWISGDQILNRTNADSGSAVVRSRLDFTPQRPDSGDQDLEFICRATLDLPQLGPDQRTRETRVQVQLMYPPFISSLSLPVDVSVGDSLSLTCSAQGRPPPSVSWSFLAAQEAPEAGVVQVQSSDSRWQEVGEGPVLELGPLEVSQSGLYLCTASNSLGNSSQTTTVYVQAPPTNVSLLVNPEQVLEGRSLTLTCQSDGAPPPTLVLSRNGAELYRENSTHFLFFNLSSIQLQDSAHYQCESTNQLGAARDGRNITVGVHPLQVSVLQQVTAADSGSSLVLTCETQGCSQTPVLTWTKTGSDSDPVLLRTRDRTSSRLVLQDLDLQDSGGYSCEAQCDAVNRSGHTHVQVYSFPSDPLLSSSGPVVLGREAVFFCSVFNVYPADRLWLQWLLGNESIQTEDRFPHTETLQNVSSELRLNQKLLQSLLHAQQSQEQQQQSLSCRVEMLTEQEEVWRSRTTSTNLQVHSAPQTVSLLLNPSRCWRGGASLSPVTYRLLSYKTPPTTSVNPPISMEQLGTDATSPSKIIPPGGNTSFDVVFLARVVGNVENTLFINTSHHGVFTYQVFGVGIPNPYRLRPFIGARVPVNSSFSPLINIHNPFSEPLQVVEMYSSGGDLHLELPTGQQGGTGKLWEIPPFETKGVMRASFSSRDADNHTAFIRIKTNAAEDQFIILPVEVEVSSAPGIYSSTEMLDFGTLRSQDRPKLLNLHLLNSGTKNVPITSVRTTPSNEAVTIDFKAVTLKAGESRYTKVASISFDASKARRPYQTSGKITVKAKEKSYSKLEIPYQAEVLEGYLGFDHTATLFHIRDSPVDPVDRPIYLTNAFSFAIRIHNVSLPEEAKTMFTVQNFSAPIEIPPHESRYIFSLLFRPIRPSIHIDSNLLLITNASKFHLPVRAYTGFLEPLVLPPSLRENLLDFGVRSATDTSSITFVVVNSNPIELELKSWLVTGDSLSMELLRTERGNTTAALSRLRELQNASALLTERITKIPVSPAVFDLWCCFPGDLASGYYAVFRVTLVAKALEGTYDGAVHITTDYEGKVVHQSLSLQSTFTQKVRLQQIRFSHRGPAFLLQTSEEQTKTSWSPDVNLRSVLSGVFLEHFLFRSPRSHSSLLSARLSFSGGKHLFDASLQCVITVMWAAFSESKPHGLALQEDIWDADVDLHQKLLRRLEGAEGEDGTQAPPLSSRTFRLLFVLEAILQKNIQAKVTAHLTWPSLVNSSQKISFPLTNTNSSSIPFRKLVQHHIDLKTLEFQVHRNQSSAVKGGSGFVEGSTKPFVFNLLLLPGEIKSFSVRFTPVSNHSVSSLLIVRNNLTVMDTIVLHGRGTTESLKVAGKAPGQGSFLRFKMTEGLLRDCTDKAKLREPNFSLKRTFRVENTGLLPITLRPAQINGQVCEGYGFKVLQCQEFTLKPNSSKDLTILPHHPVSPSDTNQRPHHPVSPSDTNQRPHHPVSPSDTNQRPHHPVSPSDPNQRPHHPVSPSDPNQRPHHPVSPSDPNQRPHHPVSPSDTNQRPHYSVSLTLQRPHYSVSLTPPKTSLFCKSDSTKTSLFCKSDSTKTSLFCKSDSSKDLTIL